MLLQAEKLATLGQVVAGVAHEINNRLTGIMSFAELVLRETKASGWEQDSLHRIVEETSRCGKVVRNLLAFAGQHESRRTPIGLVAVMQETMALLSHRLRVTGVRVVEEYAPGIPDVEGDPHQIQQVFLNLIVNAQHAMAEVADRTLTITVETAPDSGAESGRMPGNGAGPVARVSIADTGPGIPYENQARIFEPFFTTKNSGTGTGLGLAISQGIVAQHGGWLSVRSEPGHGAAFFVEFPILDSCRRGNDARRGES
jgi:signal transduction histidine kinase